MLHEADTWNWLQVEYKALCSKPAKTLLNEAYTVVKRWCEKKICHLGKLQTFGGLSVGRMPWATTFFHALYSFKH